MDTVNLSLAFIGLCVLTGAALILALEKKAGKAASAFYVSAIFWLAIQAILAIRGFYSEESSFPRVLFVVIPSIVAVLFVAVSPVYHSFRSAIPLRWLIIFQVVRIPVEIFRHFYNEHGTVPTLMTWEGSNFDILAGLTAPIIFWLYKDGRITKNIVLLWNFACLGLLLYALFLSVFSTPSAMQLFAHDTPNKEVLEFPLIWLPAFIVPLELLAHVISIEKILSPSMMGKKPRFPRK